MANPKPIPFHLAAQILSLIAPEMPELPVQTIVKDPQSRNENDQPSARR